jgi:hypothetical protein
LRIISGDIVGPREIEVIPVLSAIRAHRYKTFVGFFLTLALSGCIGDGPSATLTVGAEGFEPPVVTVDAGKSFDLEVVNDTKAVQTVTVEGRPGLRVLPGQTSERQIDSLEPGDHRVTLEGAPFEATVRAEE